MAHAAQSLRELHRLHRFIFEMRTQLTDGPKKLRQRRVGLAAEEAELAKAKDELAKLKVTIRDRESQLKSTDGQIKRYEKQTESVSSKKELDALQTEIAHAKEKIAGLEDEILTLMNDVEVGTAKLPEIETRVKESASELTTFESELQGRLQMLQSELDKALADLSRAEQAIDPSYRPTYDRLIQNKGSDGLSPVQDRVCTACYGMLTPQQYREVEAGVFSLCKNCGRIIFLAE